MARRGFGWVAGGLGTLDVRGPRSGAPAGIGHRSGEAIRMVSALLMLRRLQHAVAYALREEDFGPVLAAGLVLIATGTITYTLGNGWTLAEGFYFAVATLTTSSIADPALVLADDWMKVFTAFYILVGIGVLVEIVRRIGRGFVAVHQEQHEAESSNRVSNGEP